MTAFQATFSDFKVIKTRKVAQFVMEVPIEQADDALRALGGLPRFDAEQWVGIAPIKADTPEPDEPEKPKRRFDELPLAQQAGIIASDERFLKFANVRTVDDAADFIRASCGVQSRSEIYLTTEATRKFLQLRTEFDAFIGKIGRPQ